MIRSLIYSFTIILGFASCHSHKKMMIKPENPVFPLISLKKNPCFGHCATFQITIYSNGLAILDARENVEKKGMFSVMLDPNGQTKTIGKKNLIDWSKYENSYMVNLPDLSSTELKIFKEDGTELKRIISNKTLPDELDKFQRNISELIKEQSWIALQKKNESEHPEMYTSDIQIVLDSSLTIQALQKQFLHYNLMPKTKISEYMEHWLMSFDESKIDKYAMLAILRSHKGIRTASFNRKLEER